MSSQNRSIGMVKRAGILAALAVLGLAPLAGAQAKPVWMKLFDGQDLAGWGYTQDYWGVDSGMLQGHGKASVNTFCHSNRKYSDFVLSVKARLWQTKAGYTNSGLQYRSEFIDSSAHRMKGYQVDIGDGLDGAMYPEGAYPADANMIGNDACKKFINPNGWNHFLVTANGAKVRHELNGNFCAEFTGTVLDGYIGLQLHATNLVMKVDFKDLFIRPLNNSFIIPEQSATTLDANFASTGIVARGAAAQSGLMISGRNLIVPASFWSGTSGSVRVALNDFSGRTVYARPVSASGASPLEITLPASAPGAHILSVIGAGERYTGLLR